MLASLRRLVTFANVTSVLALFIALGGTSVAAVQLSKNSVRSKHIKNGEVKSIDIAKNAITSAKVRDGSLLAQDFKAGELPQGAKGDPGAPGAPAVYKRTRLAYEEGADTAGSGGFVKERVIGTFTKDRADTVIELVAAGHAQATLSSAYGACAFQLRIDGKNNRGASGPDDFDGTEAVLASSERVPYTIDSVFGGLAAGSHEVTLWVRGVDASCSNNGGNYTRAVYVNETS